MKRSFLFLLLIVVLFMITACCTKDKLTINSCETNDLIGTEYLKNSLINFFTKINLYEFFSKNITEYINMTLERIKLCEKYGIEDSRLSFEKSLRSKEGIVVSTIHGVKGDEFRVVIAFGLLEGYVPHWNSILETGTAREDSKKLLFVLCSRAKEKLYLFAENDRTTKKGDLYVMNKDLIQAIVDNKKFDDLN